MKLVSRLIAVIGVTLLLSQCVISRGVSPAAGLGSGTSICVVKNPDILMDGLHPEIVSQLEGMGYRVTTVAAPPAAGVYLQYTANWKWDMAMFLAYFKADLKRDGMVLGTAHYDARRGGANMKKFGHTAEKIRPLLRQLMSK